VVGEPTRPSAPDAVLPSAERLVNLTEHEVVLEAVIPPAPGEEPGSGISAKVRLPPDGRFARVDDARADLGAGWLNDGTSLISLTRLRRTRELLDLPPGQPGARYVVSRSTALAAPRRGDLVFPFDEVRDSAGRIIGARGLASFPSGGALAERYRDWRAAVRERRTRKPLSRQWLTGVIFGVATTLLGGALALLPSAVDNAQLGFPS
jgi:hypothetical protein